MRKKISLLLLLAVFILTGLQSFSQRSFPVNGVSDVRETVYAFTNATIVSDADRTLPNATLVIQKNKIIAVGNNVNIPKDAVIINCGGKYIYPSFIDIYSSYGIAVPRRTSGGFNFSAPAQLTSNTNGAFSWNQALKPQVNGSDLFSINDKDAGTWRAAGFGAVLTHQHDGIARGTGTLVTLANTSDQLVMLRDRASAHYSFSKGTSSQSYPSSLMGTIALLRQTYLNADWYKNLTDKSDEGRNLSLEAWNAQQDLPQIFEADDKWNDLRANRIAREFGKQYIIKGGGDEYQRIKEIGGTNSSFILPLNFPQPSGIDDLNSARNVTLATLMNWEMAPGNPAAFEKAGITFSLTADGIKDGKTFMGNLQKAIDAGLSDRAALNALTKNPAQFLNVYDMVGSIEAGKLANFIITDKPVFEKDANILQNWIQGNQYDINPGDWTSFNGNYRLAITNSNGQTKDYNLEIKSNKSATITSPDTLQTKFSFNGSLVQMSFSPVKSKTPSFGNVRNGGQISGNMQGARRPQASETNGTGARVIQLSGANVNGVLQGNGTDTSGNLIVWTATLTQKSGTQAAGKNEAKKTEPGYVDFPFGEYGWREMPTQKDILIKNATVWTSEKEGILKNTDVLVKNGKIAAIGRDLKQNASVVIDGTGMHLTPGIVDEHSHIAVQSINEGGQSVTSEVRIGDNLDPEDINIYRELAGGVTTAQILHGSANTIGGQSQLIKLRWGANDTALKFENAPPFIKFALGENVKRTTSRNNNRFPNTRMGVEEVLMDAFTRAKDYENDWKRYNSRPRNSKMQAPRRDLELDALVEILNSKRFITSHSYVQSEILSAMRVAEKFGFRYNTFTHILEGYKVADELKKHGANAGTFSDWWNYKEEVVDAIPQNAAILSKVGINTAINSDDAEMARRLNQEAAKSVKYGISEEDALKFVTINPATMLHVQDRVGSIKVGKDADLVLWTDNPLSVYAVPKKTIIDGIVYFDHDRDVQMRKEIREERNRLMQKFGSEKKPAFSMPGAMFGGQQSSGLLHAENNR